MSYYNKEFFPLELFGCAPVTKMLQFGHWLSFQLTPAQCKATPSGHVVVQFKSNNNSYRTKGFRAPPQLPNPILPRRKSFALWLGHVDPNPLKATRLPSNLPYSELQFLFLVLCDLLLCSWGGGINCEEEMKFDKYG
jgi:hypothetical protein